jgi:hypothetical protein
MPQPRPLPLSAWPRCNPVARAPCIEQRGKMNVIHWESEAALRASLGNERNQATLPHRTYVESDPSVRTS